jgi:hypothetical protein
VTLENLWVPDLTLLGTLEQLSPASDNVVTGRHSDDGGTQLGQSQGIEKSIA